MDTKNRVRCCDCNHVLWKHTPSCRTCGCTNERCIGCRMEVADDLNTTTTTPKENAR